MSREPGRPEYAGKPEKGGEVVQQIDAEGAIQFLRDEGFTSQKDLERVFHVVRDPRNPDVILSLTVSESTPN